MKPFKEYRKYFSIKNTKNYLQKLMLPQGVDLEFSDYLYAKISAFLLSTDARMLFIYGQFDPWSAVMPSDPHKDNIKFYTRTRTTSSSISSPEAATGPASPHLTKLPRKR